MISFKKSYAEQLLQLALALSLLQVDPRDYLNQGWDSQLEMRNGEGWQLEMLRAVPISEYPYANRKAMMPLIEDLVRFDRQNIQDITTYLLNVQNAQNNCTNVQDHENSVSSNGVTSSGNSEGDRGGITNNRNGTFVTEQISIGETNNFNVDDFDLFLNSNNFEEDVSIIDQNLADLEAYGDIPLSTFPYFGLPLKDEPPEELSLSNILVKQEIASTSSAANKIYNGNPSTSTNISEKETDHNLNECIDSNELEIKKEIKQENDSDDEDENEKNENMKREHTTEFLSDTIEMTKEESEIVEVLWKQDVDLGYSLTPPKLSSKTTETPSKNSDDDIEKLKALEELKQDKVKDESDTGENDLDDEWAGIPFQIDNETGEYIRQPSLQLDEILQDVLQLGDLVTDDQEESVNIEEDKNQEKQINFPSSIIENSSDLTVNGIVDGCTATVEPPQSEVEISSIPSPLLDFDDANELNAELDMMIQSAASPFQHHRSGQNYGPTNSAFRQSGFHHHHHHHQSRVPLSRCLSMEQRLQDIANLFNPIPGMGVGMGVGEMSPYSHYPTHYSYQTAPGIPQHGQFPNHTPHPVLHNTSLADINGAGQPHYGHNLGSAVSSSMHLTNSTHETDPGVTGYKTDPEMMYYSNTSSELSHTTDGFINSILNDEDLQLMDMGVNENFCGMRIMDNNTNSNNSSVLGSASGNSHSSNHLLPSTMTTSLGSNLLGSNTATGNEALGSTGDRLDASSDSAVSSMGSERVPSLSDGEWGDTGSDSAQEYHQGKYGGPYDYSYNNRLGDVVRQPVAQKKHQMYGKRYFQEQPNIPGNLTHPPNPSHQHTPADHIPTPVKYEYEPYGLHHTPAVGHNMEGAVGPINVKDHIPLMSNTDMKYPCSLDFSVRTPRTAHDLVGHNHTYTLPQGTGSTPRPQIRDKKQKKAEEEHLTRDEKRARSLNIPILVTDIINLPMDEFNERLSKYDLTENQLSLIRDIRRRGKNKVAAQNCRKRKLDQILSLEDEVKEVRRRKERIYQERDAIMTERKRIANKFAVLHRHIFQYLRDPDGNPCSPSQYSLQQAADGSVYLLRRENKKPDGSNGNTANGINTGPTTNPAPNHTHNNVNGTSHHSHLSQGPPQNSNHQKE